MTQAVCVLDARATLGEGPVWCPIEQALYWVDIKRPAVHRFQPGSGATRTVILEEEVGSLALRAGGGAVVALRSGFAFLDLATGAVAPICDPEAETPATRLNDGKCDRRGRFWAGSMHDGPGPREPVGGLYRLDPDLSCHRMQDGVRVSNSIAWSPDDRAMYFADSPTRQIRVYEFDPAAGTMGHGRVFATLPDGAGFPDGSTVDAEGFLWNANFDGGCVTRYAPDGRVDRVVELPVRRPTCCAFGGPGLDTLYVTSAASSRADAERLREPLAGGLFAVDVGVRGLPEPRFAG